MKKLAPFLLAVFSLSIACGLGPSPGRPPGTGGMPAVVSTVIAPTPAGTSATSAAGLAEVVQAEFARLAAGRILYNPPQEMTVGQRERVEVRITQSTTANLTQNLQGRGTPQVEQIPVASFMKVRLTGDAFEITPLSSEEQIVVGDTYTQWSWDVVPQRAGEQRLVLVVTARIKLAGYADEQKDLEILERNINVRVDAAYSVQSFFRENLNWIFPSILIPLVTAAGAWLWRIYTERRKRPGGEE